MAQDIIVPPLGESVTEATIARWMKAEGEAVEQDEPLVELETDKVTLEVNAPAAGIIASIQKPEGETVGIGDILGEIKEGAGQTSAKESQKLSENQASESTKDKTTKSTTETPLAPTPAPVAQSPSPAPTSTAPAASSATSSAARDKLSPAVSKLVSEQNINPSDIQGTGKDGRILKGDILSFEGSSFMTTAAAASPRIQLDIPLAAGPKPEERVRMSRLRQRIAERLKEAQNTAAMLTTFNEIDMTNLLAARARYKDLFEKKHGTRLGFMSFFAKACIVALKEIPAVNAEIDGDEVVYKNHYDIGIAVSSPQGLVVPVVRDADRLSFSGIEKTISHLGQKAKEGKLSMQDLTGGTFTITNGGVFGSLMSTPILNPPQSGILGMHKIQQRPMAIEGKVEVRPMMYVALTYDHRIIDGREAVTFLVRVKECIEDPERILLDI